MITIDVMLHFFAGTADLWTEERTNTHVITVTVRHILDWKMVNRVRATRERRWVSNPVSTSEGLWRKSFRYFSVLVSSCAELMYA